MRNFVGSETISAAGFVWTQGDLRNMAREISWDVEAKQAYFQFFSSF